VKNIILATTLIAAPVMAQPADLHLICDGTGDHQVAHGAFGTASNRHGSASAFGVSHSSEQFGEQMDVEIAGGVAKTRVPRRFLPPAHGGDGGWFDIKDLVVGPDEITGTVLINFANHPKLRIDRRSGAIEMDGKVGAYSGECRPYDPAQAQHAF
jgi:hypothetical protein